ncbi:FAD:protein FMN transferase [Haloplanus aerogenes]|nr:FAD:protein FMN transferase [Haloplanus aerogenes]RMB09127.1 thiamine biosynthesis lipoprotein [Haloplanus aerogenes]
MRELDRRSFLSAVGGVAGAGLLGRTLLVRGEVTEVRSTRLMMGTLVTVTVVTRDPERAELGVDRAFAEMSRLESVFTRHDSDGEVARLNAAGALADPSPELVGLLRRCRRIYDRTDGAFDPTVLPVLTAYESGRDHPRDARERVGAATFDAITVDDSELRAPTPITLDGVAKGAVVDAGVAALRDWVDAGLVEAGGDVRAFGGDDGRWRVGVENPRGDSLAEILRLGSGGVATSGDYRIYYDDDRTNHHIVTPDTGRSPTEDTSVTVVAPDAETADAYSTAAFVMDDDRASAFVGARDDLSALFLTRDGDRRHADGWEALRVEK